MSDWLIEPLEDCHERAGFCCGKPALDEFLTQRAGQYERKKVGRTYVALKPGEKKVRGYYSIAAGSVAFDHFPHKISKRLPRHPIPVMLLGRLAVDRSAQGQGLGEKLLMDALDRALSLSAQLGIHAVEVHAIDDGAKAFYEKYGFSSLQGRPLNLYLPIETYRQAAGK